MAAKKTAAGFDFLMDALKANRGATYGDLREKAEKKGLTVFPIMFGRAKALLGLVKSKKRGEGKAAKSVKATAARRGRSTDASSKSGQVRELLKTGMTAAEIAKQVGCTVGLVYNVKSTAGKSSGRATMRRGPGRPPNVAKRGPGRPRKTVGAADSIDGLVAAFRENDRERERLVRAFEQIRAVLEGVG